MSYALWHGFHHESTHDIRQREKYPLHRSSGVWGHGCAFSRACACGGVFERLGVLLVASALDGVAGCGGRACLLWLGWLEIDLKGGIGK